MAEGPPSPKRVRLDLGELTEMSKEELISRIKEQEKYIRNLEEKRPFRKGDENEDMREIEDKLKQLQRDSARREGTLVHRLTTKEQELQDYLNQIQEMKQAQTQNSAQLRSMLLDPAVNLVFQRMTKEMDECQEKLKQTQNELSAWKFTPDSQTGKRLMAKCRMLLQENEELGKVINAGRTAQLEGEIALQKTLVQEMKNNQSELDDLLGDLDEDVEGMQSMIFVLQQQLKETKEQVTKLQEENHQLKTSQTSPCVTSDPIPQGSPKCNPFRDNLAPQSIKEEIDSSPVKCETDEERTPFGAYESGSGDRTPLANEQETDMVVEQSMETEQTELGHVELRKSPVMAEQTELGHVELRKSPVMAEQTELGHVESRKSPVTAEQNHVSNNTTSVVDMEDVPSLTEQNRLCKTECYDSMDDHDDWSQASQEQDVVSKRPIRDLDSTPEMDKWSDKDYSTDDYLHNGVGRTTSKETEVTGEA